MRKHFSFILVLLASIYLVEGVINFNIKNIPISEPTPVELFMDRVAEIESDGNHKIVNRYGMMGRYQFNPTTVRGLGFRVSKQEFLNSPELQDTVMLAYMKANYRELLSLINKHDGKIINDVKISRASVLAGAHFAGSNGMRAYLASGGQRTVTDGNGTTIKKYMVKFNDVSLPPIKL